MFSRARLCGARARSPFFLMQRDRAGATGEGPIVELRQNHFESQRPALAGGGIECDRELKPSGCPHDLHHGLVASRVELHGVAKAGSTGYRNRRKRLELTAAKFVV